MRKVSLILAVLLFATPAWAAVTINCAQVPDTNEVVVSYTVTGEPNKVRAFALDIILDNDANITEVNSVANVDYTIFPGSIAINDGEITDDGTPVGDPCDYPEDSQPGLDSNGVTIEMGALYSPPNDDSPNAPPDANVLLSFFVDKSCCVTITLNEARGGVVLTNPDEEIASFTAPGVGATPCYPVVYGTDCLIGGNASATEHDEWVAWGKPNCWCYPRQCRGDINGLKKFAYWVSLEDLVILRGAINKNDTALAAVPNGICADVNHKKKFAYRVSLEDLVVLRQYINKAETLVPVCDEAPITTGPYNFWTGP